MNNTPAPPASQPALVCEVCEDPNKHADEEQFLWGPVLLAEKVLCEECADDYWPPEPTAWDRWSTRP